LPGGISPGRGFVGSLLLPICNSSTANRTARRRTFPRRDLGSLNHSRRIHHPQTRNHDALRMFPDKYIEFPVILQRCLPRDVATGLSTQLPATGRSSPASSRVLGPAGGLRVVVEAEPPHGGGVRNSDLRAISIRFTEPNRSMTGGVLDERSPGDGKTALRRWLGAAKQPNLARARHAHRGSIAESIRLIK
jgi:hypothetical protein